MKLTIYDVKGVKKSEIEVNPKDLGGAVNEKLLLQAYRVYESNLHQDTSKVKTRGEVAGSTRKIYRQKGTGRARHGAKYAPIFVGGGVAHGPDGVRAQNLVLPKKMRVRALASAILDKLEGGNALGISGVTKIEPKTKAAEAFLTKTDLNKGRTLMVTSSSHKNLYLSARNIKNLVLKTTSTVNILDILRADKLVVTTKSLEALIQRSSFTGKIVELKEEVKAVKATKKTPAKKEAKPKAAPAKKAAEPKKSVKKAVKKEAK